MLQLDILSGKQAGTRIVARRFPFSVGRSQNDDLQLNEAGVWDNHFSINLVRESRTFRAECNENASLIINGEASPEAALRNGDLLELGGTKIRVGLTPPKQKSLVLREIVTWVGLGLLCLGQVVIFYWLSK
ncbi:MAG: FHA domain-containing protein [Verrucomicrobia bacterium]|nr:FHA domain-containing protein [Verrucomicrobiota bacterium]